MQISNWQANALKLYYTNLVSGREIAKLIKIPKSTVSDFLRKYEEFKRGEAAEQIKPAEVVHDNSRILFISNMHIPYHHKGMLDFLSGLKEKYKPTRIICLGDECDAHALSFYSSDPDLRSAGDELKDVLPVISELYKMFPKMDIVDSNHGSLVWRKAKEHGIPRAYIRSYNEVLGVSEGWVWHRDLTITLPATKNKPSQQVYIHHGKSVDAIKYWANPNGLFFAINSGCLISDDSYAFAYNSVNIKRPILGTCLIIDGTPVLEAMPIWKT